MDITTFLGDITSATLILLGITYVLGGLITNLRLSRYGITHLQFLRVKYFTVGLVYLLNYSAILILSVIFAIILISPGNINPTVFLIASLIASLSLLLSWKIKFKFKSPYASTAIWVAIGTISSVFPVVVFIAFLMQSNDQFDYDASVRFINAFFAFILSILGNIYYYAHHLYGRESIFFDPIGMGVPVDIQFAGKKEEISFLSDLGIPLLNNDKVSDKVLLIDETNTHYIIGISSNLGNEAVEVSKDLVKAIRYRTIKEVDTEDNH